VFLNLSKPLNHQNSIIVVVDLARNRYKFKMHIGVALSPDIECIYEFRYIISDNILYNVISVQRQFVYAVLEEAHIR
jgi:hypothetical protein